METAPLENSNQNPLFLFLSSPFHYNKSKHLLKFNQSKTGLKKSSNSECTIKRVSTLQPGGTGPTALHAGCGSGVLGGSHCLVPLS